MAISALQIINRALRLIRVLDAGEAASAMDAQDGLDTLNALLAEWYEAKIGLPDYNLAGLTDTLATDAADRDAIAYQLAIRMAPEYGQSLSPEAQLIANETMGRLRLRYFQPGTTDLTEQPHVCRTFNITTGDY
jgi:hypothetical protein